MPVSGDTNRATIRYSGPSMSPTFFTNDVLTYTTVPFGTLTPGDIVLFTSGDPCGGKIIIHRVREIRKEGIVTQGDNNLNPDRELLTPENLVGVVLSATRAGNEIPVQSGMRGLIHHHYMLCRKKAFQCCLPLFTMFGEKLQGKHPLRFVSPGIMPGRIVGIRTSDGIDLQVYFGKFLAGWLPHDRPQWYIRPYFRLFIDPRSLPGKPEEVFPTLERSPGEEP